MNINYVIEEMKHIFEDFPHCITHTLNVLAYAENIASEENLNKTEYEVVSLAAVLHDIGAVEALKKHNNMHGVYQEMEGPNIAREILKRNGYRQDIIEAVCYIIGHHHTFEAIHSLPFQIIWEADLLENIKPRIMIMGPEEMLETRKTQFHTKTGAQLYLALISDAFTIISDKSKIDVSLVHKLLSTTYWAENRSEETVRHSMENSLCYGVFHEETFVGFGRVVTDFATFYWICDIIIEDAYRGLGLGKKLMQTILENDNLVGLLGILITKDAHGLYEQFSFEREPEKFMRRKV